MKRIDTIRCAVCTIAFMILLAGSWRYLAERMEIKKSDIKYEDFFATSEQIDVLFLGSSHMVNAVFPDQLWKNYGITSYNMANHGEMLPTSYEVLKNALDYCSPKVVVVDIFTAAMDGTYYNKSFSHTSLDAFPLTKTKTRSINLLFDETDIKCEFLSNFCLYHTRWDEYLSISAEYEPSAMKGAEMRINVESSVGQLTESDDMTETMTDGVEALLQFKDLCDEKGIKLICVNIPYSGFEDRDAASNLAARVLRDIGVPYIDFRSEDSSLQLDSRTDFYDKQHVNPLGGRKITEYLGQYLIKNCEVQDKRDSDYAIAWNEDVILSALERESHIKEQAEKENLLNTLMMMKANKTAGIIVITPYSYMKNAKTIKDLLKQMGFDISGLDDLDSKSAWIGVYDEDNRIASSKVIDTERSFSLADFGKDGNRFYVSYEDSGLRCIYNNEKVSKIHNQMMMIYLLDQEGDLLIEKGFGTA